MAAASPVANAVLSDVDGGVVVKQSKQLLTE